MSAAAHYEAYGKGEGLQANPSTPPPTPTTPDPGPDPNSVTFTATDDTDVVNFSFSDGTVDTFIITRPSASTIRYDELGLADTIYHFNPAEDRIDLPTAVMSLVKGGVITSLSEIDGQFGANQAGLFKYGSNYYLFVNDANAAYDPNEEIVIKLSGIGTEYGYGFSDADATGMTASV